MNTHTAGTYVQVSREDLEAWLNEIGYQGKWSRDSRYAGVYLILVGPNVAVKLSSTIGSTDDAMGRGQASMQLSLVSSVTNKVLNKKAQGQSHFKRTTGWKKTWEAGIDTMKKAYLSSSDFYDAIAVITDRDEYRLENMARIEGVDNWDKDQDLVRIYRKVDTGGVLVSRDYQDMERAEKKAKDLLVERKNLEKSQREAPPVPAPPVQKTEDPRVVALRTLWVQAKRSGDEWTKGFIESIGKQVQAGRNLSGPQISNVAKKLDLYKIQTQDGKPASTLF